jgi:tRNA-specific 2-thiouridylase
MKVLSAMSGGVDSSVATALLLEQGHEVVGVTMKLWAGHSDSGCCSVADVDDARRVAQQLGVDHLVFNFSEDFDQRVVAPYVAAHAAGFTPNPCVECNRHLKFARFADRAELLGFDAIATGHHCAIDCAVDATGVAGVAGSPWKLRRGADRAKDQSYVVHMLGQATLARTLFPVGTMTKADVRAHAARLGLRTADKPDSQDVCFISATAGGRETFLGDRIELHPGRVLDGDGQQVGTVESVELVTVGQRRGLALGGAASRRYVTGVDVAAGTVTVGAPEDLLVAVTELSQMEWVNQPWAGAVMVQTSAHGRPVPARFDGSAVCWTAPNPRVAPGQSVVLYDASDTFVLGGGIAI